MLKKKKESSPKVNSYLHNIYCNLFYDSESLKHMND